jgi:hypothetical protein
MRKQLIGITAFIALLTLLCISFYKPVINRLPFGVHEWAQADRLALAIKFYDNGMNFFKPATYSMFSEQGVTGVEFPIQAYLAAAFGKIFGRDQISTLYRVIDIIIVCIGLLFLFMTVFRATKDFAFSLIPVLLIFSSPAFMDYGGNYLPDPAAVSLALVAFYYMFGYLDEGKQKNFYKTVVFLTVAGLIKTSVALYLVGFLAFVFFTRITKIKVYKRSENIAMAVSVLLSFAVLFGYNRYNAYLNLKYKSTLFFANIAPFTNAKEFNDYIKNGFKMHLHEYMAMTNYILLFAIVVPGCVILYNHEKGRKHLKMLGLFLLGAVAMSLLLWNQLTPHDYYLISILFPLLGYGLAVSVIYIWRSIEGSAGRKAIRLGALVTAVLICFFADYFITRRRAPDHMPYAQWARSFWMQGGAEVMDRAGVPKNETILALQENAPNLTSVYMDRNSLTYPWFLWDRANAGVVEQFMKEKSIRILVCHAKEIRDLEANSPGIFRNFDIRREEGQIMVMELKN